MKNTLFYTILALFQFMMCCNCTGFQTEEDALVAAADSFASNYFTWHFPDAIQFADEQGQRWITFVASNVHDADIDEISKAKTPPSFSYDDISIDNDSATVRVSLQNVILMDTLGSRAHMQKSAKRTITFTKKGEQWKMHSIR